MSNFFYKIFIKDYKNIENPKVRYRYGIFASIIGIILNLILSAVKIFIGIVSKSLAVSADGFNNLSDASSSIISLIGFRLSTKPEDKEHPYGHARIEYLTGLVLSILIIFVGLSLGKSSIDKIINPAISTVTLFNIAIVVLSVPVKIFQAILNYSIGRKITSNTLIATAVDSRNDIIATFAVVVSMVFAYKYKIDIDGIMGLVVSLFIVWSGVQLCIEAASPLIGEKPDKKLVENIIKTVLSYDNVIGIHDLIIHNYGVDKVFASAHIEVDGNWDLMESHDLVYKIEQDIMKNFNIDFVTHLDPVFLDDKDIENIKATLDKVISQFEGLSHLHDLRFINSKNRHEIIFDVVKTPGISVSEELFVKKVNDALKKINSHYSAIVTFDKAYTNIEP